MRAFRKIGKGRVITDMTLFLDYMKSHDLLVCCQFDDSQIADSEMTVINSQTGEQANVTARERYGTISNKVCLSKVILNL